MKELPHRYEVAASAALDGDVLLDSPRLTTLVSAPPFEFGGPGDRWSPETLLVGAVADCFVLTFRAVARASRASWTTLSCDVTGTLDRVDKVPQFTRFDIHVRLTAPAPIDEVRLRRALEHAEQRCLISNSLKAAAHLVAVIEADVAAVGCP
jgi:uncharacterized OsmC-like protein